MEELEIPAYTPAAAATPPQQRQHLLDTKAALGRKIGALKARGQPCQTAIDEFQDVNRQLQALPPVKQQPVQDFDRQPPRPTQVLEHLGQASLPAHFLGPSGARQPGDKPRIVAVTKVHKQAWNEFVESQSHANIYHRYEFKDIVEKSFGHRTLYLAALDERGTICGVLPATYSRSCLFGRYLTSNAFFNYGGPLAINAEVEQQMVDALEHQAKILAAKHLELREVSGRANYPVRTHKVSMILPLEPDASQLWQSFSSKLRAQIRKGESHGLRCRFGTEALLDDFYSVFSQNMRDLGTPVYAKRFFKNLLQMSAWHCKIVVLYQGERPVSAAMLLGYRDTLEIPWASTLRSANRLNANMVLYWNILKYACAEKYAFFDFGRSTKDAGTYRFKKQWGAQPIALHWHYWLARGEQLPQLDPSNGRFHLAIKLWQKLPLFVANVIGPQIVKNLP